MSELAFAWRLLRRDWRTGELRLRVAVAAFRCSAAAVVAVAWNPGRAAEVVEAGNIPFIIYFKKHIF